MENKDAERVESGKENGGAMLWIILIIALLAVVFFVVSFNDKGEGESATSTSYSAQQEDLMQYLAKRQVLHTAEDAVEEAKEEPRELVVVGPSLVDCVGEGPQKCLVVNGDLFYDVIKGFEFEEGYVYVLEIEKTHIPDPPAGGSSIEYTLISEGHKVPSNLLAHNWQWVGTEYDDGTIVPEDPTQFLLVLTEEENYGSLTDCNSFLGMYTVEDEKIFFTDGASTRKACEGSLDGVFSEMLSDANTYVVHEDGTLVLNLGGGGEMSFTPMVKISPMVTGTVWEWMKTEPKYGKDILPTKTGAFKISFSADGSFGATTDCNNLSGGYNADIFNNMTFGPIASTRKACQGPSQEFAFSRMLSQTEEYDLVSREELRLKLQRGSVMVLKAVEEEME